ncbi:uncharacterized protein [Malus domestica]|uniref:uncharacterized protein n=1 Tax=Malus domestica TaxID=3750 RepID=UPI0039759E97
MGRSRAHNDHDSDGHRALHMEEHHLLIWHPSVHHHPQRPLIHGQRLEKFFQEYGIQQHKLMPRYPQSNGQVEASNKMILDCLKKSLTNKKEKWPDELPGCLWAYRTTKRRATGETPLSLAFGLEVIIHPNVIKPSITALLPSIEQNSKEMVTSLDLVEEKCEQTSTRIAAYQQQLFSSYNKRAKIR